MKNIGSQVNVKVSVEAWRPSVLVIVDSDVRTNSIVASTAIGTVYQT